MHALEEEIVPRDMAKKRTFGHVRSKDPRKEGQAGIVVRGGGKKGEREAEFGKGGGNAAAIFMAGKDSTAISCRKNVFGTKKKERRTVHCPRGAPSLVGGKRALSLIRCARLFAKGKKASYREGRAVGRTCKKRGKGSSADDKKKLPEKRRGTALGGTGYVLGTEEKGEDETMSIASDARGKGGGWCECKLGFEKGVVARRLRKVEKGKDIAKSSIKQKKKKERRSHSSEKRSNVRRRRCRPHSAEP